MNTKHILASGLLLGFLIPISVLAAEFHQSGNYVLGKSETKVGNLYVAGGTLAFDGTVQGDLVAAGGNISVSGNVQKDLIVAGGNVTISGTVGDDVRAAGGTIIISGTVNGEVVLAGGMVRIAKGAVINGDLAVAGNNVTIEGEVKGRIIRPPEPMVSREQARRGLGALIGLFLILKLLMALTTGLVFYYFLRPGLREVIGGARRNFWQEVVRGLVLLIVIPAAVVLLAVTLIGVPLAVLGVLIYIAAMILSSVFAGILLGGLVVTDLFKMKGEFVSFMSVIVGIVLFKLVHFIPLVGWIFGALLFLAALGSFLNFVYQRAWRAWRSE